MTTTEHIKKTIGPGETYESVIRQDAIDLLLSGAEVSFPNLDPTTRHRVKIESEDRADRAMPPKYTCRCSCGFRSRTFGAPVLADAQKDAATEGVEHAFNASMKIESRPLDVLVADVVDLIRDLSERWAEARTAAGGETSDLFKAIVSRHPEILQQLNEPEVERTIRGLLPVLQGHVAAMDEIGRVSSPSPVGMWERPADLDDDIPPPSSTEETFLRMLEEAPRMTTAEGTVVPDQAPAMEAAVSLRNGHQMQGACSLTPEGGVRLLAINTVQSRQGPKTMCIEHFFDLSDIEMFAVAREVATQTSSIIGLG